MKYILDEPKIILKEKYVLLEKIDAVQYPNIVKFYPDAATRDSAWTEAGLPNVATFDKYMKRRLETYFSSKGITKEICDELIKEAAKVKGGANFSGVDKLFFTKKFDILKNYTSTLKTKITNYYNKVNDQLLTQRETMKTDVDEYTKLLINFIPSISSIVDLEIIQTRTNAFLTQLKQSAFFKTISEAEYLKLIKTLEDLSKTNINEKKVKKVLKNNIIEVVEKIKQETEKIRTNVVGAFVDKTSIENLKNNTETLLKLFITCEKAVEAKITKSNSKSLPATEPLEQLINLLKNLELFIDTEIVPAELESKIKDIIATFEKFTTDINNALSNLMTNSGVDLDKFAKEAETDSSATIETNWDREFRTAVDKEVFWSSYIKRAWGQNADKINSISKALKIECTNYGFRDELNPFLSYIKEYYLNSEYNMLPQVYFAIHDAVASNYLSMDDLDNNKGTYGDRNIIFCKNLARLNGKDVLDYLRLQKDIETTVEKFDINNKALDVFKQVLGKEVIEQRNLQKLHIAIMYNIGNLEDPTTKIPNLDLNTKNLTLRPHQDIKLLITKFGGSVSTEDASLTDARIKIFIDTLKNKEEGIKTIAALSVLYANDTDKAIGRYSETKGALASLNVATITKAKKTLKGLGAISVDSARALQLIDAIAKKYSLTKA